MFTFESTLQVPGKIPLTSKRDKSLNASNESCLILLINLLLNVNWEKYSKVWAVNKYLSQKHSWGSLPAGCSARDLLKGTLSSPYVQLSQQEFPQMN